MQEFLTQLMAAAGAGFSGRASGLPKESEMPKVDPATLLELQRDYLAQVQALIANSGNQQIASVKKDKRFSATAWDQAPFSHTAALYNLNRDFMLKLVSAVKGPKLLTERIRFFAEQTMDALAPSNFIATNPDAQQKLKASNGKSLTEGISNLLADMQRGRMLQTDESSFVVGKNLAVSPGKVVFRNELIELIAYLPDTPTVHERPFLMVPPCINKFYILDLQPENSLVKYLVSQGHQVFMVSWKNIQEDQGQLTWDDYLASGVHAAIAEVQKLSKQKTINALGFCVGGTLLSAGLAALAAQDEHPVESLTLLTTLLDFSNPGVLGLFIDEQHCAMRDAMLGKGGVMQGKELATTFSFLRPNDLVWNYVVNNYLKGETPPAFDLLYWNADSTNLPGPMFTWYLRNLYLNNDLRNPDALEGAGEPIDLSRITCPSFVYGSKEDHIVPWEAAYESTQILGGPTQFVLGASGHIAGVINPAAKNKRSHWRYMKKSDAPPEASDWFAQATEVSGSWWTPWTAWLSEFGGKHIPAAKAVAAKAKSMGPAPGKYVVERAN